MTFSRSFENHFEVPYCFIFRFVQFSSVFFSEKDILQHDLLENMDFVIITPRLDFLRPRWKNLIKPTTFLFVGMLHPSWRTLLVPYRNRPFATDGHVT